MSFGPDGPPTRTRLPEGPGSGGTGTPNRRPSRSPARSLLTVAGVVVLLLAVIAFAGHSGGDSSGASASAAGDDAHAQPTAPTGTAPVSGQDAAGIAGGFAHTAQGAQSAAANYAVALGGTGMYAETTRHAIIEAVYSPSMAAAQISTLDRAYSAASFLNSIGLNADGSAPRGMTFVSRVIPAGTKLKEINGDSASVAVWYSSLLGLAGEGSTNPVTEGWYTTTYNLAWVSGDWKITSSTQVSGPAPVARDQVASSAQEMSDVVNGFGGFTYAR